MKLTDSRFQKLGIAAWVLLALALFAVALWPIRFGALRVCIVAAILFLGALGLWIGWKIRPIRILCFAVLFGAAFFFLAPGRSENTPALRESYVRSLQEYEGATYVWGGETARGLDCSGLVRRGLVDANRRRGLESANPALVRAAFDLWFFDASAKSLGEGDRNRTVFLFDAPNLNSIDPAKLRRGDIAVTQNGVHTLAYIGDQTWIEADPNAWKVISVRAPSKNAWFAMPMKIMRWRQLE